MMAMVRWMPIVACMLVLHGLLVLLPSWATGRLSTVASDPAARWFLIGASAFCLADLTTLRYDRCRPWRRPSDDDRRAWRLALATGLMVLGTFWLGLTERLRAPIEMPIWLQTIGLALMAAGVGFRYKAIRTLGPFFVTEVTVAAEQPLVQDGIFRYLRHPSEAGLMAVVLGGVTLLGSALGMGLFLFGLLPLVCYRITLEERALIGAFGLQYAEYARRVPKWLPLAIPLGRPEPQ